MMCGAGTPRPERSPHRTVPGSDSRLSRFLLHCARPVPGLRVVLLAMRNYILHQSANQAGSMAFSAVLAMFPLLILLSAAAAYLGQPGDAAALAERVMEYAPPVVRDAMQPVIRQVLAQRNQALLTIGVVVTLWTASSGMQAVRTALNRVYGVSHGLAFWKARIKVTLFTVVVGVGILAVFSSVIVMPYVWRLLADPAVDGRAAVLLHTGVRYGLAFVTLAVLYALLYAWLPDTRQRIASVVPGAMTGAALWVAGRCEGLLPARSPTRCPRPAAWRWCMAALPAWWPRSCSSISAPAR